MVPVSGSALGHRFGACRMGSTTTALMEKQGESWGVDRNRIVWALNPHSSV